VAEARTQSSTKLYKYAWKYDAAGNRLEQSKYKDVSGNWGFENYTEYIYNSANQLTDEDRWEDDTKMDDIFETNYAFDAAGNMTDKDLDDLTEANADEAWDYVYNSENRQVEVKKDTSTVGLYTYNALGNRVKKVAGTVTEELYFDGADCVGEKYTVQGESSVTVAYVTPTLDENTVITRGGTDYYYSQDGLGSVRELLDTSQTTQNAYDYEAFGSNYNWSGTVTNRYTYTGREWDSESETNYYRERQYAPWLGGFASEDPTESVNLYVYVLNNPVRYSDPHGLWIPPEEWDKLKPMPPCPPAEPGPPFKPELPRIEVKLHYFDAYCDERHKAKKLSPDWSTCRRTTAKQFRQTTYDHYKKYNIHIKWVKAPYIYRTEKTKQAMNDWVVERSTKQGAKGFVNDANKAKVPLIIFGVGSHINECFGGVDKLIAGKYYHVGAAVAYVGFSSRNDGYPRLSFLSHEVSHILGCPQTKDNTIYNPQRSVGIPGMTKEQYWNALTYLSGGTISYEVDKGWKKVKVNFVEIKGYIIKEHLDLISKENPGLFIPSGRK